MIFKPETKNPKDMNMKSNLGMLMAIAMAMDLNNSQTIKTKSNDTQLKTKPTEFKNESGVQKTIKDYQLIIQGKSKKGALKQKRIKHKIAKWLQDNLLTEDDLKLETRNQKPETKNVKP